MDYVIISKKERLLMRETLGLMAWTHNRKVRYAPKNHSLGTDADFKHLVEIGYAVKNPSGYSLTKEGISFVESDLQTKIKVN
ncbi:MAG: hypothetical protein J6A75_13720 [Lachnospiraceae bacterium]|nr:hypothetical protein [Lachnospiraceae bacterium]